MERSDVFQAILPVSKAIYNKCIFHTSNCDRVLIKGFYTSETKSCVKFFIVVKPRVPYKPFSSKYSVLTQGRRKTVDFGGAKTIKNIQNFHEVQIAQDIITSRKSKYWNDFLTRPFIIYFCQK